MASASPAARALLEQATKLWPKREKASDGLMPSAAHHAANPSSDHETGNAVDLTRDDTYFNATALSRALTKDIRAKYVIYNRQIWSRLLPVWRAYSGTNPHTKHIHVSIVASRRAGTSQWAGIAKTATAAEPALSLAISKHNANLLEGYVLSGVLKPTIAGASIVITYRRPGEELWRKWVTVKTDAHGAYKVGTRGYRVGIYTYRAMSLGDATHGVTRYVYATVGIVR